MVLNTTRLSTEQMFTSLGWDTLTRRRENYIVKLVEKCLKGVASSYFSKYFQFKRHNIHDYDIRNKDKLITQAVSLGLVFGILFFFFLRSITNRPLVSTAHASIMHAYAISSPEPPLPLSSGTGKRRPVLRFPVPLDKGNGGSGDEIDAYGDAYGT